jgi:hypothetical protein
VLVKVTVASWIKTPPPCNGNIRKRSFQETTFNSEQGDGSTFQERFKSECISPNPENTEDHTSIPGNFPQRGVEGKFREHVCISMHLTYGCEHGGLQISSGKLPATER